MRENSTLCTQGEQLWRRKKIVLFQFKSDIILKKGEKRVKNSFLIKSRNS